MPALTDEQSADLAAAKAQTAITRRPVVVALEEILFDVLSVLDHGFVRVIDYMGDDAAIVQSARVSYGRGTKKASTDEGLIRYLMRHRHTTPFEMCEIKYHIKVPIFVARQWLRHRMASVNEISARYSILDREFYLPAPEHLAVQSASNRQGRGDTLSPAESAQVLALLRADAEQCYDHYAWLMNEPDEAMGAAPEGEGPGLARELARMNLPVSYYTQFYWKIDLHNLMHFLSLRADSHAQYEIRAYADVMMNTVQRWVPAAHRAFADYRLGAVQLSAPAVAVVQRLVRGEHVRRSETGLSAREWRELCDSLDLPTERMLGT